MKKTIKDMLEHISDVLTPKKKAQDTLASIFSKKNNTKIVTSREQVVVDDTTRHYDASISY